MFKNVTTSPLKGLTVDDFMGSMGVMAAALGFDCADCHTGAGTDKVVWEDDTNRKKMARRMTEMVAIINKTKFRWRAAGELLDLPSRKRRPRHNHRAG